MPTPGETADLPAVAADTRTVIRIQPATTTVDPETVAAQFRRLHTLLQSTDRRFRARPSTLEIRLTKVDEEIYYDIGVDDDAKDESLEHLIQELFPDSYDISRTLAPDHVLHTATQTTPVGLDFQRQLDHRKDWQTCLTPFEAFEGEHENEHRRVPLSTVVETMAVSNMPMVFQCLLQPRADWTLEADERRLDIERQQDSLSGKLINSLVGRPDPEHVELAESERQRLEELARKDARRCFDVTLRAVALPRSTSEETEAHDRIDALGTAFAAVGYTSYAIEATKRTGTAAEAFLEAIRERTVPRSRRPWKPATHIVADPTEVASFCVLDGTALTADARRALAVTPGERTTIPPPPTTELSAYQGPGLTLGHPTTSETTNSPLRLPPSLQPLHTAWFGKTGSGKSTALVNALLDNHDATDGASILIDPKGDGMPVEYLCAHFARYGTLENVLYFDCATVLPAFSFFDIRPDLAAGVSRTTAVEDRTDHYIEILTQLMGRDRFEQAVRSPDVIRYLVKAMFDPINGDDAFSHRELHGEARRMHERQSAPAVSDDDLERMLGGLVANRARTFDEIMAGVANRLEKIPVDQRLARIFNHVPDIDRSTTAQHTSPDPSASDPHFDIAAYLNEDVVIIFDTGGLRSEAQRVLSLVILSNLWSALRRRKRVAEAAEKSVTQPLVTVTIEEAASIAVSQLLKRLLAQSRGFDCAITLAMQFPAQLREGDATAYEEVLNNVSTILTGNVPVDHGLAERMATDEMPAVDVGHRLRALRRGQWLCSLPAAFDDPEPRPFVLRSVPLPPGHPEGSRPLTTQEQDALEAAIQRVETHTLETAGLTVSVPSAADDETEESNPSVIRVDSALPHTRRLPPTVEYDGATHALRCTGCDSRYDPSNDGMIRAIECCSALDETEPDDVPVCDLNLKLSPDEREASDWSDTHLMFLQVVYNAQQLRYAAPGYDLLRDSMLRLQEYVGIDPDAIEDLLEADLLRHDTDYPHRIYSVTSAGRRVIGEGYRQGVDFGHGQGDLDESSLHVLAVEVGRQYLEAHYVNDPESAVTEVVPYYELDGEDTTTAPASLAMGHDSDAIDDATDVYNNRRLDVAGLDAEGSVVVAIEAERINHDASEAIPADFDKMAACNPEDAIWIVTKQADGHAVLAALNDPPDGIARVEKTYAETTPPQQFRIDTPGLTAIYPVDWLRDRIETPHDGG
ncbi:type IV secretory system conjugative DNA transfer family protein [Halapricum desulfuricans]|uniref:TraG/TraD/VirD4 family enzyme, ATPase n=1 Tax=Halapricum desulfuricans TaxID=2841257 RepID=A0A897MXD7_9EURY|nr:hypothetical protein [Halapricum desulfuricans]QSG05114.1 TraG/TraD/VirD4 family enzyme, ATPase [Halapricum desulfuricans]